MREILMLDSLDISKENFFVGRDVFRGGYYSKNFD